MRGVDYREAWEGLKILTGQKKVQSSMCSLSEEERGDFSNQLNDFYCRLERGDLGEELDSVLTGLRDKVREGDSLDYEIDKDTVEPLFRKVNHRKECGSDNICGKVLRHCAIELSEVFSQFFTWSLRVLLFLLYGKLPSYAQCRRIEVLLNSTTIVRWLSHQ